MAGGETDLSLQSAFNRFLMFLVACTMAWFLLATMGFDRLTTISLNTPLARAILYVPPGLFAIVLWFGFLTGRLGSEKLKKLRVDAPVAWVAAGIFLTPLIAFMFFFLLKILLGSTAQHLDGRAAEYEVQVEKVGRTSSYKAACRVELDTSAVPGLEAASFCVDSKNGKAIGPSDLQPGEKIHLVVKSTSLGIVATSVRRVR